MHKNPSDVSARDPGVMWITGAASGVGRALAGEALRRGYRVLATDIGLAALEETARSDRWPAERVHCSAQDVRDWDRWQALAEWLSSAWGRLDVMINNAGVIQPGFLKEASIDSMHWQIDVNLKGLIMGSRTAVAAMLPRASGHIINIASLAGVAPVPGLGYYSTSKFGARAYSLVLAEEMAPLGIKVTVLCPDLIRTAMLDKQLDYEEEAALTFSGGAPLTVEQIAACVFEDILPEAPRERLLPGYRGWLAKFGNLLPAMTPWLAGTLSRAGKRRLRQEKTGRYGHG